MASLVLKDNAGLNYKVGGRVISLAGGGVINTVSDADFKLLQEKTNIKKLIEKGFVIVGNKANVGDDIKQEALNKQEAKINGNHAKNNVKLEKEK